ncbi:MAG: type II toxin-antitoxin system RelB/DinJ family antitoxin [Clostridiales bacterium]|nr:type II toxin-antitoxin system RelB/DinJ family antitoxin [Clostridiales bacterium]
MATQVTLNIQVDKEVKEAAESIFEDLGLTMAMAVNLFLRRIIRKNGIPFSMELDIPNEVTLAAIAEGNRIARDPNVKAYTLEEFRKVLDEI